MLASNFGGRFSPHYATIEFHFRTVLVPGTAVRQNQKSGNAIGKVVLQTIFIMTAEYGTKLTNKPYASY